MDPNSLTVLPGGNQEEDLRDVEFTQEYLHDFIATALKDNGMHITVKHVLEMPFLAKLLGTMTEACKKHIAVINAEKAKKRRLAQAAEDKLLAEEGEMLNAKLREEFGLPAPLTQEQIHANMMAVKTAATKADVLAYQANGAEMARSRVLALRQELGDKLPSIAFESADGATEVRRVIKYCVQNLRAKRQEQGLDADYLAIINKLYDRIQDKAKGLFPMIDKVVVEGWGLELGKKSLKNNQLFNEAARVMSDDIRFAGMMKWMKNSPKLEELKAVTMTEAQLAEAKAKADAEKVAAEVALKKRREEVRPELKACLLEVAPELSGVSVDQYAKHLARKFGHLVSINDMFTAAANECLVQAKKNKQEEAAKVTIDRYVKAAGLTAEEFEAQFAKFHYHQERIASDTGNVGPASPLGNKTPPNGRKQHQIRKSRKSAASKALLERKPKPNEGKGLLDQQHRKPNGDKDGNKK